MIEIVDTTGDPGRSIRTEGKEDEMEGFHVEVEVEGLVEDGEEEEGSVEDEEVVVDFPVVVVEDSADAADVVESLKTEADLRKEGRIGDVASVASRTIPTGWNVTSATTPSQLTLSLQIPTLWMTPGIRSNS